MIWLQWLLFIHGGYMKPQIQDIKKYEFEIQLICCKQQFANVRQCLFPINLEMIIKVISNNRDNPDPQHKVTLGVCAGARRGAQLFDTVEARLFLLCLTTGAQ
jgi:hypothetical protein